MNCPDRVDPRAQNGPQASSACDGSSVIFRRSHILVVACQSIGLSSIEWCGLQSGLTPLPSDRYSSFNQHICLPEMGYDADPFPLPMTR